MPEQVVGQPHAAFPRSIPRDWSDVLCMHIMAHMPRDVPRLARAGISNLTAMIASVQR